MLNAMKVKTGVFLSIIFVITSCTTTKVINSESNKFVLNNNIAVDGVLELNSDYIIYPSAKIRTVGNGKVIIKEPITILGKTQIFDENINIEFRPGTMSEIYPTWFGAKGYDNLDDTKAFKKTLQIAKEYESSINVRIPIGLFYINEKLIVESYENKVKSINIIGESISQSSIHGSSLLWTGSSGESVLLIKNVNNSKIENVDIRGGDKTKHNIELRPSVYQYVIRSCTFKGCIGAGAANININQGNNSQVSEIQIENCTFHGVESKPGNFITESAIIGGLANTKNFYIRNCGFIGYNVGAINIQNSDAMLVENCTFAFNEIDIICMLCNTFAKSNYSERSRGFFKATFSSNVSFTTLVDNFFDGNPTDGYVIRDGTGNLVLINNNFGGTSDDNDKNNIKWETGPYSNIISYGNFYNNVPLNGNPFYNRSNQPTKSNITSNGDIGGKNSDKRIKIVIDRQ